MVKELCNCTGYSYEQLNVRSRIKEIVFARQLVMVELMKLGYTEERVGNCFGRHHSTANHAKGILKQYYEAKPIAWMKHLHDKFYTNLRQYKEACSIQKESEFAPFIYESLIQ